MERATLLRTLLAVSFGVALGALGARRALQRPSAPEAPPAPRAAREPLAYVPVGVRVVLRVDLRALRDAGLLGTVVGRTEPEEACEARLASQVESAVLVAEDERLRSLGLVLQGRLDPREALACARGHAPPNATVREERWRGVPLTRFRGARDPSLPPRESDALLLAWLPGGLVLAGEPSMVLRMLERGTAEEQPEPGALAWVRDRVRGHSAAAELLWLRSPEPPTEETPGGLGATVRVLGATFSLTPRPALRALAACDDFDSPRTLLNGLDTLRQVLAAGPARELAPLLERVRFERGAAEVHANLELDAASALTLLRWVRPNLREGTLVLGPGLQSAQADAGVPSDGSR